MSELCENCRIALRIAGEKYCKECRKAILQEMKDAGYLQKLNRFRKFRDRDACENVYETKYGNNR